jgi:hypothetical protein
LCDLRFRLRPSGIGARLVAPPPRGSPLGSACPHVRLNKKTPDHSAGRSAQSAQSAKSVFQWAMRGSSRRRASTAAGRAELNPTRASTAAGRAELHPRPRACEDPPGRAPAPTRFRLQFVTPCRRGTYPALVIGRRATPTYQRQPALVVLPRTVSRESACPPFPQI